MMPIYIYTDVSSPKLDYVFDFVFREQLGLAWERVVSIADYMQVVGLRLNYSRDNIDGAISIRRSDYFKKYSDGAIPDIKESLLEHQTTYDLFAAIFYLLARVEEYGITPLDNHGRFPSQHSILSKKRLLGKPIIDVWIIELATLLRSENGTPVSLTHQYAAHSTIDIDHFMAYKLKPLRIQVGSFIKDVLYLRWGRIKDRISKRDPYDTLEDMLDQHEELKVIPTVFILTAERTDFDKNLSPSHPYFKSKVKALTQRADIGIHPSYYSEKKRSLTQEIASLETLTLKPIIKARHHFLRLHLPNTYAALLDAGIKHDYSMGYPDQVGFRAGTSNSFYWYDLINDRTTHLRIHPFCVMDVTLKQYLKLDPTSALRLVQQLLTQIREVEGQFRFIWHNSSFYEREGWKGWTILYNDILRAAFS